MALSGRGYSNEPLHSKNLNLLKCEITRWLKTANVAFQLQSWKAFKAVLMLAMEESFCNFTQSFRIHFETRDQIVYRARNFTGHTCYIIMTASSLTWSIL